MKYFLILLIGGVLVVSVRTANSQARAKEAQARATRIAEHRVTLAMHAEEVRQSIGEPLMTKADKSGGEEWIYADRTVSLGHGRVIGVSMHPEPHQPTEPGRKISYDPATRTYVEHAANVSVKQNVGGGSYAGPIATPAPTASEEVRQKMGLKGSSLDQPASGSARGR